MLKNEKLKVKIQERITNLSTLGRIPADEVQLNLDVAYNSILDEICAVVPMESPRQIISYLQLRYGMPQKAVTNKKKDVIDAAIMDGTGALPLDEFGYITDEVEFTATETPFMGMFKNILPGTVKIGEAGSIITDDGAGNLVDNNGNNVGTVDYEKAVFAVAIDGETPVRYKFDLYNVDTSRNLAYFVKATKEVFAQIFQLDVDSAVSLNDFKGVNLQQNIDKLLPEVLAKQIDSYILEKYFEYVDAGLAEKSEFDFVDWRDRDIGAHNLLISLEMSKFAKQTGVVPNIILCNPVGLALVSSCLGFTPITPTANDVEYSGTPRKVGYFNNAKVFVTSYNNSDDSEDGKIVLTYRGMSDAQTSGVYSPFIPVTLRTVSGAEAGGMIVTNNIYSISGFTITNGKLIRGITVKGVIADSESKIYTKVVNTDKNITEILEQTLPELGRKIDTQTETIKTQVALLNANIDEESAKTNTNIDEESAKTNSNIDEESAKTNANLDEESAKIQSGVNKAASDVTDSVNKAASDVTNSVNKAATDVAGKIDKSTADIVKEIDGAASDISSGIDNVNTRITGLDNKVSDVDAKVYAVGTKVDIVDDKVDTVDGKVSTVNSKTDTINSKVDSVNSKVDGINSKVDTVDNKIDVIDSKVDNINN